MCAYKILHWLEKPLKPTFGGKKHQRGTSFQIPGGVCDRMYMSLMEANKHADAASYLTKHEQVAIERYWLWMFDTTSGKDWKAAHRIPERAQRLVPEMNLKPMDVLCHSSLTSTEGPRRRGRESASVPVSPRGKHSGGRLASPWSKHLSGLQHRLNNPERTHDRAQWINRHIDEHPDESVFIIL